MSEDKDKEKKTGSVAEAIQSKFIDDRKVFLWGEVSDKSARDITEKLLHLEATDPGKEITFYINSPGGSITAGMAIYDTMQLISSPIKVVVTGMAASMGSILLVGRPKDCAIYTPTPVSSYNNHSSLVEWLRLQLISTFRPRKWKGSGKNSIRFWPGLPGNQWKNSARYRS